MINRVSNWQYFANGNMILGVGKEEIGEFVFEAEKAMSVWDFGDYLLNFEWITVGQEGFKSSKPFIYIWLSKNESTGGSNRYTGVNISGKLPVYDPYKEFYERWGTLKTAWRDLGLRPFSCYGTDRDKLCAVLLNDGSVCPSIRSYGKNYTNGMAFDSIVTCSELRFHRKILSALLYFKEKYSKRGGEYGHKELIYARYTDKGHRYVKYLRVNCEQVFRCLQWSTILAIFPVQFDNWQAAEEAVRYLNEDANFTMWV